MKSVVLGKVVAFSFLLFFSSQSQASIGTWFRNLFATENERFRSGEEVFISNEFFYERCKLEEIRSSDRLAKVSCGPHSLTHYDSTWQDIAELDAHKMGSVVESHQVGDLEVKTGQGLFVEWAGGYEDCTVVELREGAVAKLKCVSESSLFENAWFDLNKLKIKTRSATKKG